MVKTVELVNPNQTGGFKAYGFLNPPYNLWLIALAFQQAGFEVRVVDEVIGETPRFDTEFMMITAYTFSVKRAIALTKEAQSRGIKVMLGGIHVSDAYRHDFIYKETQQWRSPTQYFPTHFFDEVAIADSVCIGEIEPVLMEIIADLQHNRVKHLYFGSFAQSNQYFPVTMPDWSKKYPLFPWESSRGCPWLCDFCEVSRAYGRAQRTRPLDVIIKEIEFFQATRRRL